MGDFGLQLCSTLAVDVVRERHSRAADNGLASDARVALATKMPQLQVHGSSSTRLLHASRHFLPGLLVLIGVDGRRAMPSVYLRANARALRHDQASATALRVVLGNNVARNA